MIGPLVPPDVVCDRIGRCDTEPTSSGSPPDDCLGESRPLKTAGDDMLADGSTIDGATGHSAAEAGTLPVEARSSRPKTSPGRRVPTAWDSTPFRACEDIKSVFYFSCICVESFAGHPSVPAGGGGHRGRTPRESDRLNAVYFTVLCATERRTLQRQY